MLKAAICLCVFFSSVAAQAVTVTEQRVRTVDRGELRSDGLGSGHHAGARFSVGMYDNGVEVRNYFAFNLAGITETIAAAELLVSPAWLYSPDAFETFELHQMSSLTFNDAGDGPTYYSGEFPGVNNGVRMPLNEAALADLNAARGGSFMMGGRIASLSSDTTDYEILFSGYFEPTAYMLVWTVAAPEPSSWSLIVFGLAMVIAARRRSSV